MAAISRAPSKHYDRPLLRLIGNSLTVAWAVLSVPGIQAAASACSRIVLRDGVVVQ